MAELFIAVLAALLVRDFIRYAAGVVEWRWSVNKGYSNPYVRFPLRVRVVRILAGKRPEFGR